MNTFITKIINKIMSEIKTVEIVEMYPAKVWHEKDIFGTVHIKMQHEGMDEFDFISCS